MAGNDKGRRGLTTGIRRQVEQLKRRRMVDAGVVNLSDFRELKRGGQIHTVLVVDDDELVRNALKRILEKEGYRVILAEDGLELSSVLEHTRLDLILLDINLPWVDGYELCSMLKGHPSLRQVPLILISGNKSEEDVLRGFQSGCDEFLSKPFDLHRMTRTIGRILAPDTSQSDK